MYYTFFNNLWKDFVLSLYGDKTDYEELVKDNIQKAKILVSIPEKNRPLVLELLKKREEVIKKNGLFVNLELKKIDKKINKLKTQKIDNI